MTLFVDASALVSILAREPDAGSLADQIDSTEDLLWSPMSCWETIAGLRHSHHFRMSDARMRVESYASARLFRLVPIAEDERREALGAYERYGRGSGQGAKLNMGDCFAYACAKTNGARLLYKGDDFAKTDLA